MPSIPLVLAGLVGGAVREVGVERRSAPRAVDAEAWLMVPAEERLHFRPLSASSAASSSNHSLMMLFASDGALEAELKEPKYGEYYLCQCVRWSVSAGVMFSRVSRRL